MMVFQAYQARGSWWTRLFAALFIAAMLLTALW